MSANVSITGVLAYPVDATILWAGEKKPIFKDPVDKLMSEAGYPVEPSEWEEIPFSLGDCVTARGEVTVTYCHDDKADALFYGSLSGCTIRAS